MTGALITAGLPPMGPVWASAWTTAWIPDILIIGATAAYGALLHRRRAASGLPWRGRAASWTVAMVALVICFNSSVSIYSDALFFAHMIQHLLLIMVVPPFLVWADPFSLVELRDGRTVMDVLDSARVWRAVTFPLLSVPVYAATVILTHVTSFQQFAVTHPPIRIAENLLYLVSGYLLFAELIRTTHGPRRVPDIARLATIIAAMGVDTLSGLALMLTAHPLAPAYAASHPEWGPGALADQNAAGALMWVFGDLIMMVFLTVVGVIWGRNEDAGVGNWLESIRRRQMLGDGAADGPDLLDAEPTIDVDQAALDAYNARLALLYAQDTAVGGATGGGPAAKRSS